MTDRIPLVQIAGQIQQLPAGDSLAGVGGGVPTLMAANQTFTISDNCGVVVGWEIVKGPNAGIIKGVNSALVRVG